MRLKIFLTIAIIGFCEMSFGQQVALTLSCPPCRPVTGCDQCWVSQAEANASCSGARLDKGAVALPFMAEADFNVYPNPSTNGVFSIENVQELSGTITIYNQQGMIINEYSLNGQQQFRIGNEMPLSRGLYLLRFTTSDQSMKINRRLIVK